MPPRHEFRVRYEQSLKRTANQVERKTRSSTNAAISTPAPRPWSSLTTRKRRGIAVDTSLDESPEALTTPNPPPQLPDWLIRSELKNPQVTDNKTFRLKPFERYFLYTHDEAGILASSLLAVKCKGCDRNFGLSPGSRSGELPGPLTNWLRHRAKCAKLSDIRRRKCPMQQYVDFRIKLNLKGQPDSAKATVVRAMEGKRVEWLQLARKEYIAKLKK